MTDAPERFPFAGDLLAGLIAGEALSLPPGSEEKLAAFCAEMLRWNRTYRLTAITDPGEIAVKHILDSLILLRFSPFPGRILDFGSGAGFPGIPLAVALPGTPVVLLESSGKKCAFLSHVRSRLCLSNVDVVRGRLASGVSPPFAGRFEHVVTRATLPPARALPLLLPHLSPGGRVLLMTGPGRHGQGGSARGEPGAASPGAVPGRVERFSLPMGMGRREIREFRAA